MRESYVEGHLYNNAKKVLLQFFQLTIFFCFIFQFANSMFNIESLYWFHC